jgi:ribosomal protein L40E
VNIQISNPVQIESKVSQSKVEYMQKAQCNCIQCSHDNPVGSKFCNKCGSQLSSLCSECGSSNPTDASFCNQCGSKIEI